MENPGLQLPPLPPKAAPMCEWLMVRVERRVRMADSLDQKMQTHLFLSFFEEFLHLLQATHLCEHGTNTCSNLDAFGADQIPPALPITDGRTPTSDLRRAQMARTPRSLPLARRGRRRTGTGAPERRSPSDRARSGVQVELEKLLRGMLQNVEAVGRTGVGGPVRTRRGDGRTMAVAQGKTRAFWCEQKTNHGDGKEQHVEECALPPVGFTWNTSHIGSGLTGVDGEELALVLLP